MNEKKPNNWSEFKKTYQNVNCYYYRFYFLEKFVFAWVCYWLTNLNFFKLLGSSIVIITLIEFCGDLREREKERTFRAWDIVYNSSGKGGDGMKEALEYLNSRNKSLMEVDLSKADLRGINLKNADLRLATLVKTDLRGADLRGAIFNQTRLQFKGNWDARIEGANIFGIRYSILPNAFQKWALENGAVEIKSDNKWSEFPYT